MTKSVDAATGARVAAQAKVNLFLRVLAREASGYHQLETLFQRLDLADDVRVRVDGRAQTLDCRGADVGPVERNLAWRAAQGYAARVGWPHAFAIEIDKRIPVGGGLGGGSADAGAVLRCLNALCPTPLDASQLLQLAAPLGADVPFLTAESVLALAWGRGERMLALPPLAAREVTLLTSGEGVATADAYRWLADARGAAAPVATLLHPAALASWDALAQTAHNDFEAVVPARHAAIAARLAALRDALRVAGQGGFALLAGSGATVFGVSDGPLRVALPAGAAGGVVATRTATRVAPVRLGE